MILSLPLPKDGRCLLKQGDKINFGDHFLEINQNDKLVIPVAKKLNIAPAKIFKYLKKFVGEKVEKNELLAEKKDWFGSKKILAEKEGIVNQIDHQEGTVIINVKNEKKGALTAFFVGEVSQINKDNIEIKVKKGKSYPSKESDNTFGGPVFYFLNDNDLFSLSSHLIADKLIVIEKMGAILQTKNETLGAKGFITLNKLPEKTNLHFAQIKNIDDFKNICYLKYPYCLNVKEKSIIYFYE